jgi:DNA-binding CsgD family transcriptional regulator
VHRGEMPLPARVRMLFVNKPQMNRPEPSAWARLTDREKDIAWLLKDRLSDKEIASQLNLSVETVRTHIKHIFDKFNLHDRHGVIVIFWGSRAASEDIRPP